MLYIILHRCGRVKVCHHIPLKSGNILCHLFMGCHEYLMFKAYCNLASVIQVHYRYVFPNTLYTYIVTTLLHFTFMHATQRFGEYIAYYASHIIQLHR